MKKFHSSDPNEKVLGRSPDGDPITSYREAKELETGGVQLHPPIGPTTPPPLRRREVERPPRKFRHRTGMSRSAQTSGLSLISWPTTKSGSLIGGPWPSPPHPSQVPPPETLGSASWWATSTLGSEEQLILLAESLISGQGSRADSRWIKLCQLYREWERLYNLGDIPQLPSLNALIQTLDLPLGDLIPFLQSGIRHLSLSTAQVRLAVAAPQVVEAALRGAYDVESGFQDRKLLFEALGLTTRSPLVAVNNSNSQTVVATGQPIAAQPKALQKLTNAIDIDMRESEAVEGEIVEDSDV